MVLERPVPLLQQEEEVFGTKESIHETEHNGNKNTANESWKQNGGETCNKLFLLSVQCSVTTAQL